MSWQILVFLSVLTNAVGEIGQKISVSTKSNLQSETVNFFVAVIQLIFSLIFVLITNQTIPENLDNTQIANLIFCSLLGFFFFKFLYQSYKGNSASISQIIFSFSVVVSSVLGIIFFNESTSWLKFIGIILILFAIGIANYSKKEKITKYNIYALIAAITFAFMTNIDKSFSIDINVHWYQVYTVGMFVVVSLIIAAKTIIRDLKVIKISDFRSIIITAIAFTIFNKLTFMAFSSGAEVGKVDAINNTVVFVIIFLEYFLLKDRKNLRKKILGGLLALFGTSLLLTTP